MSLTGSSALVGLERLDLVSNTDSYGSLKGNNRYVCSKRNRRDD
jgi:hypothetical protein